VGHRAVNIDSLGTEATEVELQRRWCVIRVSTSLRARTLPPLSRNRTERAAL